MKKKYNKLAVVVTILTLILAFGLTGCNSEKTAKASSDGDNHNSNDNTSSVTVIKAATTGTGPKPFVYSDEENNVTGYEVALLKKIFEELPQYKLEIVTTEFASIFTGIDSEYYQLGFNQISYNHERGEKYLFTDPISDPKYAILAREDDDTINSIEDLGGHKTVSTVSDAYLTVLNNYNDANPSNKIDISYTEDSSLYYLGVTNGTTDFYIGTRIQLDEQIKKLGLKGLKVIDIPDEEYEKYKGSIIGQGFVVSKNNEKLAKEINEVIEKFINDGTIEKLTDEWLGIENATPITEDKIKVFSGFIEKDQQKWFKGFGKEQLEC